MDYMKLVRAQALMAGSSRGLSDRCFLFYFLLRREREVLLSTQQPLRSTGNITGSTSSTRLVGVASWYTPGRGNILVHAW